MADREVAVTLVAPASTDYGVNTISASAPGGTFTKLRSGQVSDVVARNPIQEEAMDITAPASIVAGAYGVTGTIECPLRKDTATKALFQSLMGEPATADNYTLTHTRTNLLSVLLMSRQMMVMGLLCIISVLVCLPVSCRSM